MYILYIFFIILTVAKHGCRFLCNVVPTLDCTAGKQTALVEVQNPING